MITARRSLSSHSPYIQSQTFKRDAPLRVLFLRNLTRSYGCCTILSFDYFSGSRLDHAYRGSPLNESIMYHLPRVPTCQTLWVSHLRADHRFLVMSGVSVERLRDRHALVVRETKAITRLGLVV